MRVVLRMSAAELDALIFAVKSDLETGNNDIENFPGDDEQLLGVLQQLEDVRRAKSTHTEA